MAKLGLNQSKSLKLRANIYLEKETGHQFPKEIQYTTAKIALQLFSSKIKNF